jgi:hypothetical protein
MKRVAARERLADFQQALGLRGSSALAVIQDSLEKSMIIGKKDTNARTVFIRPQPLRALFLKPQRCL